MAKTANDPLFATSRDPIMSGRHAVAVTPNDTNDLANVSNAIIVTTGAGATGIAVIMADDTDNQPVTIPLPASTCVQLYLQVRRVMSTGTALGTGGGCVATWG